MTRLRKILALALTMMLSLCIVDGFSGCDSDGATFGLTSNSGKTTSSQSGPSGSSTGISEQGEYTSAKDVALYLHTYNHLPGNFITKKAAEKLGWEGGSLEPYAPGCSIGGDYFGNYEKILPVAKGTTYHECDIDTKGKNSRGSKRLVWDNHGNIYYSTDHYESFKQLY